VAIVVAAVTNLMRSRGPGALNTVWIEDAQIFLSDALVDTPRHNLLHPFLGYYHVGPRVLAEIAAAVPVRWSAPLLELMAALITAGFAAVVFVASERHLPQWWLRLLVSAPVVLMPLGRTQSDSDVATLHFIALYAFFWVLLWRPAGRIGKVAAVAATLFLSFSSILPVVYLPLVILRVAVVKDWTTRFVALAYAAGMGLQVSGSVFGWTTRSAVCCRRYEPLWVVQEYVLKAVPRSLLGESWLGGPGTDAAGLPEPLNITHPAEHAALIVIAWLMVSAVIACGVAKWTSPHWPLAALAATYSVVIFAAEVVNFGYVQPRYVIVPGLLLYTALAAVLRAGPGAPISADRVVFALSGVLLVVIAANFRVDNGRTRSDPWSQIVRDGRAACATAGDDAQYVNNGPEWWRVRIPCRRLR
jgi:hypothetical protein